MEQSIQTLAQHLVRYPGMEPADCILLAHQQQLGGGYAGSDAGAFAEALRAELACADLKTAAQLHPESVGNGWRRVHLSGLGSGLAADTVARLCLLAAARRPGSKDDLRAMLTAVRAAAGAGALPGAPAQLAKAIDAQLAAGCPAPCHSARFNALYRPHYRLVDAAGALYLPVLNAVDRALAQKNHVLVAIDGMSAAGKSGLAQLLQQLYGCGLVHVDDFFLQPHQRTQERLAQPGGNVDYERLRGVAARAADDRAFCHEAYSCRTQRMEHTRRVPAGRLTVLEGAYALHPAVEAAADVRVFLSVNATVQRRRITARQPEEAEAFFTQWIPMENRYFSAFEVRGGCDVQLDTGALEDRQ